MLQGLIESERKQIMTSATISHETHVSHPRDARRLLGLGLSGLTVALLAADAAGKLLVPDLMIANTPPLGLPADPGFYRMLGAILAIAAALYAFPRTALLGAVLLTGYLGGAVAIHLRVGDPLFSATLFGVYLGVMAWGGLWLRDPRLRALFPLRG
jgi:DoxX-like family